MPWFDGNKGGGEFILQQHAVPRNFARLIGTKRNGLYYANEIDGKVFTTRAGFYSNQPQPPGVPGGMPPPDSASIGFAGTGWELLKNGRRIWKTGGAYPQGSWTAPTGHTPGTYYWRGKGPSVPYFDDWAGEGSYAVVRNREAQGYPARPNPIYGGSGAGGSDDTEINGYLHVGMPRMLHNFTAPRTDQGYPPGPTRDAYWISQMQGTVDGWERWKGTDPARPFYPLVFCHVDGLPGNEAAIRSHVNDPMFKGKGVYWEAGNERFGNVFAPPGGGNLGNLPPLPDGSVDPADITLYMSNYAQWVRSTDPTAKVMSPSTTELGGSAEAGLRAFWGTPRVQAANLDAMTLHAYNWHQGDMAAAFKGIDTLLSVRRDLNLTMPIIGTELGNMMHSEHGKGRPMWQAWQVLLDFFAWELLGFRDAAPISASKETRTEFHNSAGGFWDHPGWWQSHVGPYVVLPQILTHSQELFGMAQKPVAQLDVGTDDANHVIGLEHRAAAGHGVLAVLADSRESEMRLRIPGGAGQTVHVTDSNGMEVGVTLDSDGIATFSRAIVEESPEDGRTAYYVRLTAAMGHPERVESDKRRWGTRVPDAQMALDTNGGSAGNTKLVSVGRAGVFNNPVAVNRGINTDDTTGIWRTAMDLDNPACPPEGLWVRAKFPTRRVRCLRVIQPPYWQYAATVREALFEVKVDGVWQEFGTVNELSHTTAYPIRNMIYWGLSESRGDGNRMFYATSEDGIVTGEVRFRATDITAGPCLTWSERNGLGAKYPTLATVTNLSGYPREWAGQARTVPIPNSAVDNPWAFGNFITNPDDPALNGYWDGPRALWAQDLAVFGSPLTGGGSGGHTPPPDLVGPPSGIYYAPRQP